MSLGKLKDCSMTAATTPPRPSCFHRLAAALGRVTVGGALTFFVLTTVVLTIALVTTIQMVNDPDGVCEAQGLAHVIDAQQ